MDFNAGYMLTKRSRLDPDKPGLVFEGRTFSFREMNERCNRWANAFRGIGVNKGDRVGILLHNCNEFLEAYFAAAKIGAVVVLLNCRLAAPELEFLCQDSKPRTLIFGQEFSPVVERIKGNIDGPKEYICVGSPRSGWAQSAELTRNYGETEPSLAASGDDPVVICYTSGTTGVPKPVALVHENIFWYALSWLLAADLTSQDRVLQALPLFHNWGLTFAGMADVCKGCTTVMLRNFDATAALTAVREEKVTVFPCVPAMLKLLADVPDFDKALQGVRLFAGAGVVSPELFRTFADRGIMVGLGFGSLEAGCGSNMSGEKAIRKPESAGQPFFYTEMRVVGDGGMEVPPGEVGELLVKGPTAIREEWNSSALEAVRNGWVHTGDLAKIDEESYVYIVGRKKEMILSGGEHIYPYEIEKLLESDPKIAEAVVVSQPDKLWGETAVAIVRPKPGQNVTPEEIIAFCQGKIAHFKIPRRVVLVAKPFSRNALGKVIKQGVIQNAGLASLEETKK
jgi:fatty-acyl-CoA synthase